MKKVRVGQAFDFSHDGMTVVHYQAGEQEMPADAAGFSVKQGFAQEMDGGSTLPVPETKPARKTAPKN